ncbi:MAG TPA: ribosome biogenesis factor YjgA [Burkholderiaceae bacterium]|nr:ribosome biogenesis factor YjgA [Burkholderiaceae bacterium]
MDPLPRHDTPADAGSDALGAATQPDSPSKTRRKREMIELQQLGERLLELPSQRLRSLALPETLIDAVELAQRIGSREGRRRQLQYIGRLMRDVDPAQIRALFERDDSRHRADTAAMHAAEHWRDTLLSRPQALTDFVDRYPRAAGGDLHALVRAARREVDQQRPGRNFRELFRALKRAITEELEDDER